MTGTPYGTAAGPGSAAANQVINASQVAQTLQNLVISVNAILAQLTQITPALVRGSGQGGFTAHAGGGQGSAVVLTAQFNEVATVATAADSAALLTSTPGLWQGVQNAGAHALQLFGQGADTINGSPAGTGVSIPAGHSAICFCAVAGKWAMVPFAP
jgi:hypothetical protein